jgi:hypothetical protein
MYYIVICYLCDEDCLKNPLIQPSYSNNKNNSVLPRLYKRFPTSLLEDICKKATSSDKTATTLQVTLDGTELQPRDSKQLENMQTKHNKAIHSKDNVKSVLFLQFDIIMS